MKELEKGVSSIAVIIAVSLAVLSVLAAVIAKGELRDAKRVQRDLKVLIDESKQAQQRLKESIQYAIEPLGFDYTGEPEEIPLEQIQQTRQDLERLCFGPRRGSLQDIQQGLRLADRVLCKRELKLKGLQMEKDLIMLRKQGMNNLQERVGKIISEGKGFYVSRKRACMEALQAQKRVSEQVHSELKDQKQGVITKIEQENAKHKDLIGELKSELMVVKGRLTKASKELKLYHKVYVPHGRIISTSATSGLAFIDMGENQRVTAGLRFLIGNRGKGYKVRFKGEVLVKRVFKDTSQVLITKLYNPRHPLIEGDSVYNPLFDTKRALNIAVIFIESEDPVHPLRLKHPLDETKRRVLEVGGNRVVERVDIDTDLVILAALEGASNPETKKAEELAIPIIAIDEIYPFIFER